MRRLMLLILLFSMVCSGVSAQSEVPPDSLRALQDMFGRVRDNLWQSVDEYWHSGDYERCIAVMRLITNLDPHDTTAYDNAAWLMANQLRDNEAEAFYKEGILNNPDSGDLYFELGRFYYERERFHDAVANLEMAVNCNPIPMRWNLLAHASEHAGLIYDTIAIWAMREAIDPDNNVPRNQLDRIMSGGPSTNIPAFLTRAREQRRAEEHMEK